MSSSRPKNYAIRNAESSDLPPSSSCPSESESLLSRLTYNYFTHTFKGNPPVYEPPESIKTRNLGEVVSGEMSRYGFTPSCSAHSMIFNSSNSLPSHSTHKLTRYPHLPQRLSPPYPLQSKQKRPLPLFSLPILKLNRSIHTTSSSQVVNRHCR